MGEWGWSIERAALYLGLLNLAVVPLLFLPLSKWLTDRQGIALCGVVALSSVFFFEYGTSTTVYAVLYGLVPP